MAFPIELYEFVLIRKYLGKLPSLENSMIEDLTFYVFVGLWGAGAGYVAGYWRGHLKGYDSGYADTVRDETRLAGLISDPCQNCLFAQQMAMATLSGSQAVVAVQALLIDLGQTP